MIEHLLEFIGRTHLVVLHFPIALIVVTAVVEIWRMMALKGRAYTPSAAGSVMFLFALLGAAVSVITGLVLGFDGGERVDLHRILGIVSGVLMVVTWFAWMSAMKPESKSGKVYLTLLCLSAASIGAAGHFGGELTHGEGFLTKPLKEMVGMQEDQLTLDAEALGVSRVSAEVFELEVLPIMKRSCVECHGPDEAEDDIRLDTLAYVLDRRVQTVRRGDPDGSELVYRIELPHDDPDIMPPEGDGEPLTSAEVKVVRDWIASLSD
ncbi:MAG: c-type cytochrome domain-containing protein [Phycisphaerales bacterium]